MADDTEYADFRICRLLYEIRGKMYGAMYNDNFNEYFVSYWRKKIN